MPKQKHSILYHQYTLVNPGAETGDMTGWTASVGTGMQVYTGAIVSHSGTRHFWGSLQSEAISYQDVTATTNNIRDEAIDAGKVIVRLLYWGTSFADDDLSVMYLEFYDVNGTIITDTLNNFPLLAPKRSSGWNAYDYLYFMLPGTRTIRVYMRNWLIAGSYIDGHIDDIELHGYILR